MTTLEVDGLRWALRELGDGPPLVLLHGFTGTGAGWDEHACGFAGSWRVLAPDLPGHGGSGTGPPERMSVERTADDLATLLGRLGALPASVLGYSLGARIALRLAVAHPSTVSRLVLESPSAGIDDAAARRARRGDDEALATRIERGGVEAFVDEWERQPVFASQVASPPAAAGRIRAMRLSNTAAGLAASLRGAGQGSMEPLFDRLRHVAVPTLVIAGALDDIGRPRAERVAAGIPNARLAVVDGAGHAPHDERPDDFRRIVLDFLQEDPAA